MSFEWSRGVLRGGYIYIYSVAALNRPLNKAPKWLQCMQTASGCYSHSWFWLCFIVLCPRIMAVTGMFRAGPVRSTNKSGSQYPVLSGSFSKTGRVRSRSCFFCCCCVFGGEFTNPWEACLRFSHEILRRMHSKSCLGTPWGPRYEHICQTCVILSDTLLQT